MSFGLVELEQLRSGLDHLDELDLGFEELEHLKSGLDEPDQVNLVA